MLLEKYMETNAVKLIKNELFQLTIVVAATDINSSLNCIVIQLSG